MKRGETVCVGRGADLTVGNSTLALLLCEAGQGGVLHTLAPH